MTKKPKKSSGKITKRTEPVYLTFRRRDGTVSDIIPLEKEPKVVSVIKYETE